jgi:hypothetical protein
MDVIAPSMPWPASTWMSAVVAAGLPLPLAASTSTACLYGLPLQPASTACLYSLPLRLRPASTPTVCLSQHLHHITVIIVIVIVHFLFKRNIYLSLYM